MRCVPGPPAAGLTNPASGLNPGAVGSNSETRKSLADMTDMTTDGPGFAVTDAAAAKVAQLIEAEGNPALKLRVQVLGGGCSGFQYDFRFDEDVADDDLVIEKDGVTVLVDSVSLEYLRGSEFDYVEEMIGSSFQVRNPNATSSCGCGTSFSVM